MSAPGPIPIPTHRTKGIGAKAFPINIGVPISHFPNGAPDQIRYINTIYFYNGTNGIVYYYGRTRIRPVLTTSVEGTLSGQTIQSANPDAMKQERLLRLHSIGIDPSKPQFKLNVLPAACYGALYAAQNNYPQAQFDKLWAECLAGL